MKLRAFEAELSTRLPRIAFPLLWCFLLLATSPCALAQLFGVKDQGGTPPPPCVAGAAVETKPTVIGLPVAGFTVQINAFPTKVVVTQENCQTFLFPVPQFSWRLVTKPSTSLSQLAGSTTFVPSLLLDVPGTYLVQLTVCASGCTVNNLPVEPRTAGVQIVAVSQSVIPPETVPLLPPSATAIDNMSIDDANAKCNGGLGASLIPPSVNIVPEWVTVNNFAGPQDYQTLEGRIESNRVSSEDNPLTHFNDDLDFFILPDPSNSHFLFFIPGNLKDDMEAEWERQLVREFFWPTPNDRVSVFGYWVHDCGHPPFDPEIHPPVGFAIQRSRPVPVPPNVNLPFVPAVCPGGEPPCPFFSTIGTNVAVPGVVTDIFFGQQGGGINAGCGGLDPIVILRLHTPSGNCLQGPSALNRVFEFNIYLPRDPRVTYVQGGKTVPEVPLYFEALPGDGPSPVIARRKEGDVSFLHVTIDLTTFQASTYSRRIVAGGALAAPDNWGLKNWKLRVNSIDVLDSSDPTGNGDWRLWVNTNNRDGEWTRVIDCDTCINEGSLTSSNLLGPAPWETGVQGALGPDIQLFQNQNIWVHASAFESDLFVSDDLGTVNDLLSQAPVTRSTRSCCGDASKYILNYEILADAPPPAPTLSVQAQTLFDAYTIRSGSGGAFPTPVTEASRATVTEIAVAPGSTPINLSTTKLFRQHETESRTFPNYSQADLTQLLTPSNADPNKLIRINAFLAAVRGSIDAGLKSKQRSDALRLVPTMLRRIKQATTADLYRSHFADLGPSLNISGDVNGDGVVDNDDLARIDATVSGHPLLATEFARADVAEPCGVQSVDAMKKDRSVIGDFIATLREFDAQTEQGMKARLPAVANLCHAGKLLGFPLAN